MGIQWSQFKNPATCKPRIDSNGRAVYGAGLRPLTCWNCRFELRRRQGCLSLVRVMCCCQVEVSAPGRSLIQRSLIQCGVSVIVKPRQSGNPDPLRAVAPRKKKILRLVFETEESCNFTIKLMSSYLVTPVYCNIRAQAEILHNACLVLIKTSNSGGTNRQ
jgi:hypothetical protein